LGLLIKRRMKIRQLRILFSGLILGIMLVSCAETGTKKLSIIETTDIHGVILPYDYTDKKELNASLASCYSYIRETRSKNSTILLDNGDNLQGQPAVYYYNFIDTVPPHLLSEVMNFMEYDAGTVGNHDIETGHAVYDRLIRAYKFPLLAANAIDTKTGKPYFKPYVIIERDGIRIAVFGLVTPQIPEWLPSELYSGMEFDDMVETAKKWMPEIKGEKPDLIVGLFHSGWNDSEDKNASYSEDGSAAVAYNVPGFDIIFTGHDHRVANEQFINSAGDTVLILNGGSKATKLAQADITFTPGKNKNRKMSVTGKIINVSDYNPDSELIEKFTLQHDIVYDYVNRVIGTSSADISSRDAYFGSSAFVDLIHSIQTEITGSDISFAAPLSFDVKISRGPVTVGDLFKLYRFENMLYTMTLSGEEIRKYLEFSYSGWLNTMKGSGDGLLKFRTDKKGRTLLTDGKAWLQNQPYNFESAMGIDYIVDVSKPAGSRIEIKGFTNGQPFVENKIYKVSVNSYRGNGGGGHFTEGAGIDKNELRTRLVKSTERDLRYYILKAIEARKTISPEAKNNWKIIPEKWVQLARKREYPLLFGAAK
jgi:2',3'-cyclic-nucleotide 2'-phosphodiesterase / 3'-nucleotidase